MTSKNDISLIILTYKGKVLLRLHNTDPSILSIQSNSKHNVWSFFSVGREKNKTLKASILSKLEQETGLRLLNADFLLDTVIDLQTIHYYHASLNDDNVNSIQRENGATLQFFAMKELGGLNLTKPTKMFVDENNELMLSL